MPIFIDRHDMRGMTAKDIAEAHRRDLDIQDKYGVKYMTYWFDPERGAAFCLVDAPDAATATLVHREAHGEVATNIIAVDLAVIEDFLGRINDPPAAPGGTCPEVDAGLRAIMFTDIAGSTEMILRLGDAAAVKLVRVHDGIVRRAIAANLGREVKHTGDGIMAVFDTVPDAVYAAASIQRQLSCYNKTASERLSVRIGIDAGEPVAHHNDLFGETVHVAARLCGEAETDGVVVSALVRKLLGQDDACCAPLGERLLKGFAEPIPAFSLNWWLMKPGSAIGFVD